MSGGDTRPRWASASRPSGLSIASRVTMASITIIWDAPSMQRPLPVKERDPVRHRLARKCPCPCCRSGQAVVLTDESQILFFDEVLRANLAGREASLPYPPADGLRIAARSSGDLGDREHDCRILQPDAPNGI